MYGTKKLDSTHTQRNNEIIKKSLNKSVTISKTSNYGCMTSLISGNFPTAYYMELRRLKVKAKTLVIESTRNIACLGLLSL